MKLKLQRRRGFTLVELLVVVTIILALAGLSYPVIMNQKDMANKVQMTNSSKQILMVLNDFNTSFHSFPDDSTAERIEENPAFKKVDGMVLTGDTSNPYFRQLIASGKIDTEDIFFAKINSKVARTIEPDHVIAHGQGLVAGENAYCYVMIDRGDSTMGLSGSSSGGAVPVLVTLVNETANAGIATYDLDALKEQVFVARADNSATFYELDQNGHSTQIFRQDVRGRETAPDYRILRAEF